MRLRRRAAPVPERVSDAVAGEKVLASCRGRDGRWLLGTRDALWLVPESGEEPVRLPWQEVLRAEWDRDAERLRVVGVAEFGQPLPTYSLEVAEPGQVLQMVRERVTASVVLQRRVPVVGRQGLTVVARRAPHGDAPVTWSYELDEGLDPDDPTVVAAAEEGLRAAADELGM